MPREDERGLSTAGRATAAAGAAFVAAAIVNPLDVIKTRIQAAAMQAAADPQCATPVRCVSTLYERWGITEGPPPVRRSPYPAPASVAAGPGARGAAAATAGTVMRSSSIALTPAAAAALGSSCACAAAAASAQLPTHSMWETAKAISRREGLPVLWRGTSASLLIAVPMVGIYMPLYDALLDAWGERLGGVAPVASGTAARTAACFCVAPFELLRTRLQASAGAGVSMRGAVIAFLLEGAGPHPQQPAPQLAGVGAAGAPHGSPALAGVGGSGGAGQLAALQPGGAPGGVRPSHVLRAVPRMWTGFSATLVRDVPFSALYWALVEPFRRAMLPVNSHWAPFQAHYARKEAAAARRQAAAAAGSSSSSSSSGGAAGLPWVRPACHSQAEILVANMVSGFIAGGVAAGLTTPFDVVKTRMQISARQPQAQQQQAVWPILRDVYRRDGLEGLFTGLKPRAYRAAPACAIVISVYELLKASLAARTPRP